MVKIPKLNNIVKNKTRHSKVIPASFIIILIAFIHFLNICISYVYICIIAYTYIFVNNLLSVHS